MLLAVNRVGVDVSELSSTSCVVIWSTQMSKTISFFPKLVATFGEGAAILISRNTFLELRHGRTLVLT